MCKISNVQLTVGFHISSFAIGHRIDEIMLPETQLKRLQLQPISKYWETWLMSVRGVWIPKVISHFGDWRERLSMCFRNCRRPWEESTGTS